MCVSVPLLLNEKPPPFLFRLTFSLTFVRLSGLYWFNLIQIPGLVLSHVSGFSDRVCVVTVCGEYRGSFLSFLTAVFFY